jgi:hypothetical protein
MAVTSDFDVARTEVLETLEAYGARTRSEMITAARIIAFSFSALELLAEAKNTEMEPAMRLRVRACANNLNRSSQQDEKSLAKRLLCDIPDGVQSADDLIDDMPEAEFEAALQHAQAEIASYRNRLSGVRPAHSPQPQPPSHNRPLGGAVMNAFAQSATPPQPA